MEQAQQTAKRPNGLNKPLKSKQALESAAEVAPSNPAIKQVMEMLGSWRKMAESEGMTCETYFNPVTGIFTLRVGNLELHDGEFKLRHVGNIPNDKAAID